MRDQAPTGGTGRRGRSVGLSAGVTAAVLAAALVFAVPAAARGAAWDNPLADHLGPLPGPVALSLHVGSVHLNGVGLSVGLVPLDHLEVALSYGYRDEHSAAALVKANILPRAPLCPYVRAGYAVRVAALSYDIQVVTHQVTAGAGVHVRVLERFFVGVEGVVNVVIAMTQHQGSKVREVPITQRVFIEPGFMLGVYLP